MTRNLVIYEDPQVLLVARAVKWRRLVWTGHTSWRKVGASKVYSMRMRREKNTEIAIRNKDAEDVDLTELPQHRIC
jgi:hypothetical protein